MTNGNWHQIWVEQCAAAETIKLRYGLTAAFDYAVAEKLLNFAEAAAQHPEFARELPRFVSRVRQIFTAQELVLRFQRLFPTVDLFDDGACGSRQTKSVGSALCWSR